MTQLSSKQTLKWSPTTIGGGGGAARSRSNVKTMHYVVFLGIELWCITSSILEVKQTAKNYTFLIFGICENQRELHERSFARNTADFPPAYMVLSAYNFLAKNINPVVAQVPYGPDLSCRLFPEDVNLNQLRRADHLTRGVLPILVCLSVIKQRLRGGLGPLGLSSHERKKKVESA